MTRVTFPMLYSTKDPRHWREMLPGVPWSFVEKHEAQALRNHDQTLERLAERGGLCPSEMLAVIEDRRYVAMSEERALDVVMDLLRSHRGLAL